jgi:hypothetical protein
MVRLEPASGSINVKWIIQPNNGEMPSSTALPRGRRSEHSHVDQVYSEGRGQV